MALTQYILVVILLFAVGVGIFYIYLSFSGPRKIDEIEKMLAGGRLRAAIDELGKLLEKDDRNLRARYLLARAYRKMGNNGAAALELRQCLKINKFTPEVTEVNVRSLLALALLDSKNFNEAKNEFLILTTLAPREYENFFQLGKLFFQAGDHTRSIQFLMKSSALNDRHAESFSLLGQSHYHLNAYQDARAALLKAVQLKPNLYVAHYFMGLALRYLQDLEWAVKEFEKAEKDETIRPKAILGKGMALIDQEAYPKAMTELDRGVRFAERGSDTEVNMRYLLALAAEKSRDMHTAISNWEKIENIKPGFRDVRDKLKQYAEFRVDDSIKDFMILSNAQFEDVSRRILHVMGQQIINIRLEDDSTIEALTMEESAGKRVMRKQHTLININRDNLTPLSESQIRDFHEAMKEQNAARGIIMTAGEISGAAQSYAESRPIEIYNTSKLAGLIRDALEQPSAPEPAGPGE